MSFLVVFLKGCLWMSFMLVVEVFLSCVLMLVVVNVMWWMFLLFFLRNFVMGFLGEVGLSSLRWVLFMLKNVVWIFCDGIFL